MSTILNRQKVEIVNLMKRISLTVLVATITVLIFAQNSYGQVSEGGRQLEYSQQFRQGDRLIRVAEPGQLVDSVSVWGDINSAGRYLIPADTRLHELISYGFGPATIRDRETTLDWSKLRLEVKVSRYNKNNKRVEVANFKYKYNEPEPDEMFEYDLKNNDIVTLQVKRKPAFIDYVRVIAPIISGVATSILIVDRLR